MNESAATLRRLGLVLLAGVLAACSQLRGFERPAAPIPARWPASAGAPSEAAGKDIPWQEFFADATLQELLRIALAHNRDLRVAALGIEQAAAQLGLRGADQWPTVNASLSASRAPNSARVQANSWAAGFAVTAYEIDFFGRVASLKEQALAQFLASQEAREAAQFSLVAAVAQTWMGLLADEELLALSGRTLATREASLELVALRHQHGAASELELRLAQSLLASARVTLAQQQRQRAMGQNALALLLGQPVPPALLARLPEAGLAQLNLPELPAGLPSELLARRPDIRQAEQQLSAANANVAAARAAFFPRISLTAAFGTGSSQLSGLFSGGSWAYTLAPQLVLPILDAGRNQAGLDAARVGFDIAVAQYERAIQAAFREAADALAGRETLMRQLEAQQAQAEAEAARLRLTELRLQAGAASQLEWLDAQRSLFASEQALLQLRLAYQQNLVTLYKTLGGGASKVDAAAAAGR